MVLADCKFEQKKHIVKIGIGFSLSLPNKTFEPKTMTKLQTLILSACLVLCGCQSRENVDLIIKNAKIFTVNSNFAIAQCAAIKNGKFIAVGSDANIVARYQSDSVINLSGMFVYPAFVDANARFSGIAYSLYGANLSASDSLQQTIAILTQYASRNPYKWIIGYGWSNNSWNGPDQTTIALLNKIFSSTPVFLWNSNYTCALANDCFFSQTGIKPNKKEPGFLRGNDAFIAAKHIPNPDAYEMEELYAQAQQKCLESGLCAISDIGITANELNILHRMQEQNKLNVMVYAMPEFSNENKMIITAGPRATDMLKKVALFACADGTIAQHQAVLLNPYADNNSNAQILTSTDSLMQMCQLSAELGYQMCIAAHGDSAARAVLHAYTQNLSPKNNNRWRIDNIQLINQRDANIISRYNIIPTISAINFSTHTDSILNAIGRKRSRHAFEWKTLMKQNQIIVNGSEATAATTNPLANYCKAITREKIRVPSKTEQELTPVQALKAMTIWPATAMFCEKEFGSIEKGKWANFVVTNQNLLTAQPSDLNNNNIKMTFVHGVKVFERK